MTLEFGIAYQEFLAGWCAEAERRLTAEPSQERRLRMYKLIVRQIVRRTFARLSAGDYEAVVKQFGPRSRFVFSGDHALGGERRGQDAVQGVVPGDAAAVPRDPDRAARRWS